MENSFHFFPLWKRGMKGDLTAFQKAKLLRKREISGLVKATKETGCKKLAILTWDYESQEDSDPPIKFQPVWKWLLKQGE
jgi:predicted AAA+ superfamily ATPase